MDTKKLKQLLSSEEKELKKKYRPIPGGQISKAVRNELQDGNPVILKINNELKAAVGETDGFLFFLNWSGKVIKASDNFVDGIDGPESYVISSIDEQDENQGITGSGESDADENGLVIIDYDRDDWPIEYIDKKEKAIAIISKLKTTEPWLPESPSILIFKSPSEKEIKEKIKSMLSGVEIFIYDPSDIMSEFFHEIGHVVWRDHVSTDEKEQITEYHANFSEKYQPAIYNDKWMFSTPEELFCTLYLWYAKGKIIDPKFLKILNCNDPAGSSLINSILDRIGKDKSRDNGRPVETTSEGKKYMKAKLLGSERILKAVMVDEIKDVDVARKKIIKKKIKIAKAYHHLNKILKAGRKDVSKLKKIKKMNKRGHMGTYYVRPEDFQEEKKKSIVDIIKDFFGFDSSSKVSEKIKQDYAEIGKKHGLDEKDFERHYQEYFSKKQKWDNYFKELPAGAKKESGTDKISIEKKSNKKNEKPEHGADRKKYNYSVMRELNKKYGGGSGKKEKDDKGEKTSEKSTGKITTKGLIGIDGKAWDVIGAEYGAQIRGNDEKAKKYANYIFNQLDKRGVKSLSEKVFHNLENENAHLLNAVLSLGGYFGKERQKDQIDFINRLDENQKENYGFPFSAIPEKLLPGGFELNKKRENKTIENKEKQKTQKREVEILGKKQTVDAKPIKLNIGFDHDFEIAKIEYPNGLPGYAVIEKETGLIVTNSTKKIKAIESAESGIKKTGKDEFLSMIDENKPEVKEKKRIEAEKVEQQKKQEEEKNIKDRIESEKKSGIYDSGAKKLSYGSIKMSNFDDPIERKVFELLKVKNTIKDIERSPFNISSEGQKSGVWTDSRMMIIDKKISDEIYNANKQRQFFKRKKEVPSLSDEDIIHEINVAGISRKFPDWKSAIPKEYAEKTARFTGNYSIGSGGKKIIEYSDGENTARFDADYVASLKNKFSDSKIHLTGIRTPGVFVVNGEVKAVLMPLANVDVSKFSNINE